MSYWERDQKNQKSQKPLRVKADMSKLVKTPSISAPSYYESEKKKCRGCGKAFVFEAQEQMVWFERFGIPHYATRTHCFDCAAQRLEEAERKQAHDDACKRAKSKDATAVELVTAAQSACDYSEHCRKPLNIERTTTWLYLAQKRDPSTPEPEYWLGRAFELHGNSARAIEHYSTYCKATSEAKSGQRKALHIQAKKRLKELR